MADRETCGDETGKPCTVAWASLANESKAACFNQVAARSSWHSRICTYPTLPDMGFFEATRRQLAAER